MMKTLKRSNFFPTAMFTLFAFCVMGLTGCEQEDVFDSTQTEYLELGTYETSAMTEQDFQKMFQAIERMDVRQKQGIYHVNTRSGSQVNISEELFDYIKNGFDYSNKTYRSTDSKSGKFQLLRLKQTSPEGQGGGEMPTDCMVHAIAEMAGVSISTVEAWLTSQYGNDGVPTDSFQEACSNFAPGGTYGTSGYQLPHGNQEDAIIVIQTANGQHAVNAKYYDSNSGVIIYEDNQAKFYGGPSTGYTNPGQVLKYYSND